MDHKPANFKHAQILNGTLKPLKNPHLFAEGSIKDSVFAIFVSEADGGTENSAETDVFAEYHRRRIGR